MESIIESAQVETTMKRLLDEIESTKRRVNALEFKVIPELTAARDFITMRLDEMEREELFRLKNMMEKGDDSNILLLTNRVKLIVSSGLDE